ncbi:hypothetical protein CDD83_7169 [Cordyceps sp. RAO-2017]|nr:hypothetical protein CDD83_7169 [Cordyceps sp. RAO-2017]
MQKLYLDLHQETLDCSGVILAIPEHILSYQLSGFQQLADSKVEEAEMMTKIQAWLTRKSRDVLDESDFTLAVKTQLIYPSGQLMPIDGHPDRWKVAQTLLALVQDNLDFLQKHFPFGVEVVSRSVGYPLIQIIQPDVESALQQRLIDAICEGHTSIFRLPIHSTDALRKDLRQILCQETLDDEAFARVSRLFADNTVILKRILLVRGLVGKKILFLCLRKRWNVQYGLHPKRLPLAVPFEAKGTPSEQAEFGHPDVAILFTCLSFYYSGLSKDQLRQGLEYVLKSDDPASEYDAWTAECHSLPEALRHWNLINVDDQGQVDDLWGHLRLSRHVLDHYMNHFVFPRFAKQFGVKLQSSGWDIPLFALDDSRPCARTTGFSGTNDNRRLLPLTIQQLDLPNLNQTSAEVLTYLLQKRSRECMILTERGKRLTEEELLRSLTRNRIRILIDAGAYILEMDNKTLVEHWLRIDSDAAGGVYFAEDNRAWFLYQGGKQIVPLLATPFAENLEGCLVYLDEAHTRGTDLKLPRDARGALTLALGQTKDHTVQAAMRLRQLATTQSILFCAPSEVYRSILDVSSKEQGSAIDSADVVHWLLEQTCRANEQLQTLFTAQGFDFCDRTNAKLQNPDFIRDRVQRSAFIDAVKLPERLTLDDLYGNTTVRHRTDSSNASHAALEHILGELERREKSSDQNGPVTHDSALDEVEQEREVEFQVEEVREVQKPRHWKSLGFPGLHPTIARFVESGVLYRTQGGVEPASKFLERTCLAKQYNLRVKSRLLVSAEFSKTTNHGSAGMLDDFLRPVEWILWNPANETALVIIPEEAELLIPTMRTMDRGQVHLMPYGAPANRNMLHSNGLAYYVLPGLRDPPGSPLPQWLSIELGVLGAKLYFAFDELEPLSAYLKSAFQIGCVPGSTASAASSGDVFAFLLEWFTIRRKGQDILHTPMGYICQGRPLTASHPFFVAQNTVHGDAPPGFAVEPASGSAASESDIEVEDGEDMVDEEDGDGDVDEGGGEYCDENGDGGEDEDGDEDLIA